MKQAQVILDQYKIYCIITNENDLRDLEEIIKQQLERWGKVEIAVNVKHLICIASNGE